LTGTASACQKGHVPGFGRLHFFFYEKIAFKVKDEIRVFNVCDIIYLVASGSYTLVYLPKDIVKEGFIQVTCNMKTVLNHCQGEIIRVHKSYSVNPDKIISLSGNRIRLEQNGVASVSPEYREALLKVLNVVQPQSKTKGK
jgi:DNA-binding LytR/AlgR family response regulator